MIKTTVRKIGRVGSHTVKPKEDVKGKTKINVIVRGAIPPDLTERLAEIQAAAIRFRAMPMQPAQAAGRDPGGVMSNDHSQEKTRERDRKTPL